VWLAASCAGLAVAGCGGLVRSGAIAQTQQLFDQGECAELLRTSGAAFGYLEGYPELQARVRYLQAECLSRMQRDSEARALYRFLAEQFPTSAEGYLARTRLASAEGGSEEGSVAATPREQPKCDRRGDAPPPISRPEPAYPTGARELGVEGWVLVQYDITRAGRTERLIARAAQPAGVFEASALDAVASWTYQPRDGRPGDDAEPVRQCSVLQFRIAPGSAAPPERGNP
jgi:TonB family protein